MHKIKRFRYRVNILLGGVLKRLTSGVPKAAKYIVSNYISLLALVVSVASSGVTLYLTFFRHIEDFRVYFRFSEPLERLIPLSQVHQHIEVAGEI
jgi:hypothetical protein